MKLADFIARTGYLVLSEGDNNTEIKAGYAGDLLSDVMANTPSDSALITIQAHKNTVAVATLVGARVIVICNGKTAPEDMIQAAKGENIAILSTKKNQFNVSAEIAKLLSA
ncbi:MAG: iron-sulfur binding hydrogenase [Spirochaetaceae bacterium]|nr:iron-sulfur binding hydrogenase [Spirochaetaceae bacterium]